MERRTRKSKNITTVDELYKNLNFDTPTSDSYIATDDGTTVIEHLDLPKSKRRGLSETNLTFNHTAIQAELSLRNNNQQLRNYRSAMDYLSCADSPVGGTLPARIKSVVSKYPNIDLSPYFTQEEAAVNRHLVRVFKQRVRNKFDGTAYILGGGIGLLAVMLFDENIPKENKVRNIDVNPKGQFIADFMMTKEVKNDWQFKATTENAFTIDYASNKFICVLSDGTSSPMFEETPGVVINSKMSRIGSTERWYRRLPEGDTLYVLVGESMDRRNTIKEPFENMKHFDASFPMDICIFRDKQVIGDHEYYFKMGYK